MNHVSFPLFDLTFNINPIAFSLGTKNIYWYGIIIATGLILGLMLSLAISKKYTIVSADNIYDIVLIGAPVAIICARIYYVIFYPGKFQSFGDIFKIWEGGIAIYGAIIGAFFSTLLYCRKKKLNFPEVADICCYGLIVGQIIGRWGNFMNVEAYGYETLVPWRMEIMLNGEMTGVHPTFLYESLWNTVGLIILLSIRNKTAFRGEIFLTYALWYGLGRSWIEGLRTDSLYLFANIRVSQALSIVIVLACLIIIIRQRLKIIKQTEQ